MLCLWVATFRCLAFALFFWVFLAGSAMAGTIVLEAETYYDAMTGEVAWTVRNTGDTLADAVVVSILGSLEQNAVSEPFFLDGGDSVSGRLAIRLTMPKRGTTVLPVRIDYSEATGRRYSTFSWVRHTVGEAVAGDSRVLARLEPPELSGRGAGFDGAGSLALTVLSFSEEPLVLNPTILLPQGLALAEDPPEALLLAAGGMGYWEFSITNTLAGVGGVVPAGVLLAYETNDGQHHVAEAVTRIPLAEADAFASETPPRRLSWSVPLVLALTMLVVAVRRGRGAGEVADSEAPCKTQADDTEVVPLIFKTGRFKGCGGSGSVPTGTCGGSFKRLILFDWAVVIGLICLIGVWLNVHLTLLDTLCVGGDTPAHHYLAGRIGEAGSIVSWAPGWWSGFPMFRYYFPLPYVVMSILAHVIPHNVAFKVCAVAGLLFLPLTLYLSGRILRLKRPVPVMLACLALPLVFDNTHNMWGVNAYSTLAGMIANSWSFAILPLAMASACRDVVDSRVRVRSVLLLTAMVLSHFFTSMLAAMVLTVLLTGLFIRRFGQTNPHRRWMHEPWVVLLIEGGLTFLLTAWWVLPLVANREWAVDFGGAWDIRFFRQLAPAARWFPAGAMIAWLAAWGCRRKWIPTYPAWSLWVVVHGVLLGVSMLFFFFGGWVSPIFVNCRFWPFIIYALLALSALIFGHTVRAWKVPLLGTGVVLAMCLAFGWREGGRSDDPIWSKANYVPFWAAYNFRGLEALREGHVVRAIANRLTDTPGRLAQDLHPGNEWLGSSRIFEVMPHLAGKAIVEGGIVNSALGSLAAYTVQGEISDQPAGWPLRVEPRTFNPASGLRHLEFMGVRQFVARSRKVQAAFEADAGWERTGSFGGSKWLFFESTLASASPVRVWKQPLRAFVSEDPQGDLLAWMYVPSAISEPMVLVLGGAQPPDGAVLESSGAFNEALAGASDVPPPVGWLDACSDAIDDYTLGVDGSLRFCTEALGEPHVLALSYDPAWRVRGADAVHFVTPGYCVVYPTEKEVILTFEKGLTERVGEGLGFVGLLVLGGMLVFRIVTGRPPLP